MPEIAVYVEVLMNGKPMAGFPYSHRRNVENVQEFLYEKQPELLYRSLPVEQIFDLQALLVANGKPVCYRLNSQTDAAIEMNAGGILIVMDGDLIGVPGTNATVQNKEGNAPALLEGLGGGSGLDDTRAAVQTSATTGTGGGGFGE